MHAKETRLTRLTSALRDQEFCVYYQPKVNMRTGAVTGAEALIRWNHPNLGILEPSGFLPSVLADHTLSLAVEDWVLETVIKQILNWKKAGLNLRISINITGEGLQRKGFVDLLKSLLAVHPEANPRMLEFEIVETTAIKDINAVIEKMTECQRLGVRFAVDDFGTGYSSLTYLRRLPAETLKIDQSFVRDMLADSGDLSIVQAVIGLAKAFNREVVAEGVETIAHGVELLAMGCELAQGCIIARPMAAEALADWVRTWQVHKEWSGLASNNKVIHLT